MNSTNRISLTPTVARQTQQVDFGHVLKNTLQAAAHTTGALLNAVPGGGIISAAVSNVTALASGGGAAASAAGITGIGQATTPGLNVTSGGAMAQALASSAGAPAELNGMVSQMRAEADRSTLMQMQMQQESREYNTISNVLKVRHDSAKAAINNIR